MIHQAYLRARIRRQRDVLEALLSKIEQRPSLGAEEALQYDELLSQIESLMEELSRAPEERFNERWESCGFAEQG